MSNDMKERVYYSLCKSYKFLHKILQSSPDDDVLVDEIIRVEERLRREFSHYQNDPTWPFDEQIEDDDLDLPPLADEETKKIAAFVKSVVG